MKLVGLCSFYDESPTWLAIHAAASAKLVDHIIYVDGAYLHYDREGRSSGVECHDAIARACHGVNVGHTLHVPDRVWDSEVEKRGFMFHLAEQLTTDQDYYIVIDADTILTTEHVNFARDDLEQGDFDAYNVNLLERWDWNVGKDGALIIPQDGEGTPTVSSSKLTCVFRAIRGLTVMGAHYLFVHPDENAKWGWRALWGPGTEYDLAPAGDLELNFEHWSKFRPADRRKAADDYYKLRDNLRLERTSRTVIETVDGDLADI